jgi:glycosyltransferase involved in cell wall biosynthesis
MEIASVIITTYRRTEVLLNAVNSVLRQDYDSVEIIIVDDNGRGTKFQKEVENSLFDLIIANSIQYLILEKNTGACNARNVGAQRAKGNYLFFLDDDDIFLDNKVSIQVEYLKANKEKDGCLTDMLRFDGVKKIVADSNKAAIGDFTNFVLNGNFFTPMLCIRKASFIKSKGFISISRFQDRYFMLHCLKLELKFSIIPKPLYVMNEHNDAYRITNQKIDITIEALNKIHEFILKNKFKFKKKEWARYLEKHNYSFGQIYYNSNYIHRIKSIYYWVRCLLINFDVYYAFMIIKSLYPKSRNR